MKNDCKNMNIYFDVLPDVFYARPNSYLRFQLLHVRKTINLTHEHM